MLSYVQRQHYEEELCNLKANKGCTKRSPIVKLDPVAVDGLLTVGGRLSRSAIPLELKHPMIIPKDSHVFRLLLQHIHERVGHSGRNHMLSRLSQRYWIPCANYLARKIINDWLFCRRRRGKVAEQKMADFSQDCVSPDLPPFTHVSIDYFGPIEVIRGRARIKRCGVIFTCLVCRAVHLEVASHLDTDSCINAFRRFICRRGPVSSIRTDQGTNLIGTQRELAEALSSWTIIESKMQS